MSAADGSIGISRKRRRMSPEGTSAQISRLDMPGHRAGSDGTATNETKAIEETGNVENDDHAKPCPHQEELRTLHTDLHSMRQLITCNICQRFMYEPYALPCGHTYCYSCLAEWMGKNHKKTCPDCRTYVKQEPTSAFLIREMVQIFVNRTQLLPDGETSEEHHQMAREEADIITKDRADEDARQGGLFKGTFSRQSARAVIALHDTSDFVDRCPNCLHEVEDGWCLTCHVRVRASDADSDDSGDGSIDGSDILNPPLPWDVTGPWETEGSSEDDSELEEDERDLSGFVENDVRWESDADEPDYSFEAVEFDDTPDVPRAAPVSDVSDSEDDSDGAESVQQPVRRRLVNRRFAPSSARPAVTISSDSGSDEEEEDEDDTPVQLQRRRRNRYHVDNDTDDEEDSDAEPSEPDIAAGFSPLQHDSDDTVHPATAGFSPPPGLPLFDVLVNPVSEDPSEEESSSDGEESGPGADEDSNVPSDDDDGDEDRMDESRLDEDSEGSENTPIEPNPRHRLVARVQRRSRFVDVAPSARYMTSFTAAHPRRSVFVSQNSVPRPQPDPASSRATQTCVPPHPFNLDSTLGRIAATNRNLSERPAVDSGSCNALNDMVVADARTHPQDGLETLRPRHSAHSQAECDSLTTDNRNRQYGSRYRQPEPAISSLRRPGDRRQVRILSPSSSSSSRTARNEENDTGNYLMGAIGDMSDDSTGW